MSKFTFEMYLDVTEQTTVEADSVEEAKKMVYMGDCEWEALLDREGGEIVLINEEEE